MRTNKIKKKDLTKMTMFSRDNYISDLTRELDKLGHIEFGLPSKLKHLTISIGSKFITESSKMFPNFLKIIIIITIGDQEKNGSREKDKKK